MNSKIALVIGASIESIYAIKLAQKLGYYVIAFDGNSNAEGLIFSNEHKILDINNSSLIISYLQNRIPQIVLPVPIGRSLITTGEINDYYQLKGINNTACNILTDKHLFHITLNAYNLRQCTEHFLVNFAKTHNTPKTFPCILKPRFGSGNKNIFIITNKTDYINSIKKINIKSEEYICESKVSGIEYGLDGIVINNQFYLVLLRKKLFLNKNTTQCIGYFSVNNIIESQLYSLVQNHIQKVISVLQIKDCVLHADIIENNGQIFIIELSPRPSGHFLHNNFTIRATKKDIIKQFITPSYSFYDTSSYKTMLISYFTFENCLINKIPPFHLLKQKYNIEDYKCNLTPNQYLDPISDGKSLMPRGYYILSGKNESELLSQRTALLNEFEVSYEKEFFNSSN